MKIYFSCAMTGGRDDQPVYAALVGGMSAAGHEVLTAHLASPEAVARDAPIEPAEVYRRDLAWLDASRAMVAEVSTPSHGVGYEVACALMAGKPVLCLAREGAAVSKILTGNRMPGLRLARYAEAADALRAVESFLAGLTGAAPAAEG